MTKEKEDQLRKLLKSKKGGKKWMAKELGLSLEEFNNYYVHVVGSENFKQPLVTFTTNSTTDVKNGKAEQNFDFKTEIHTLEELIEKTKIDVTVWNIDKYVQNFWGNENDPHWQVKAFMSKIVPDSVDRFAEALKNFEHRYKPLTHKELMVFDLNSNGTCVVISLADPHIDKKTLDKTTIEEKCATYLKVLINLLVKTSNTYAIEEIVFVLGNDYFTSDSYHNTTTNLTPQGVTDDYDDSYEKGFALAVESISLCKQFCEKLRVVFVPANHDRTKSFYLVHALEVFFSTDKNISFDRTAENTKIYTYGQNFIGFHHGDTKMEALPLYFASKYKREWGACKYAEIALGDKHHKKQWSFKLSENEVMGTRMFIVPSLTTPDKWHKDKTYDLAIQAGVARVYDKNTGYTGEAEERI
jgi:hypothetical protein